MSNNDDMSMVQTKIQILQLFLNGPTCWVQCHKTFFSLTGGSYKLESLSLADLSSLASCLQVRQGAYPLLTSHFKSQMFDLGLRLGWI
jgi:hypothetical protein